MTAISATKKPSDLQDVLGRVDKVFYNNAVNTKPSDLTGTFDFMLPVLDESVTFNLGGVEVSRIKLIDQTNWTSYAKKGDPDISFQVPSFSQDIADILGNKIGTAAANTTLGLTLQGYSTTPKKVVGSLLYVSEDGLTCVYLPKAEIYATAVIGESDKPGYFNCTVTPLPDKDGVEYYIGRKSAEG